MEEEIFDEAIVPFQNLDDIAAAIQEGINDIQLVETDIGDADGLLNTIAELLDITDPIMEDVAEIGVDPLPALGPIGRILDRVKRIIRRTLRPALQGTRDGLGGFRRFLRRSGVAATDIGARKRLRSQLLKDAKSVTIKLNKKFKKHWPEELKGTWRKIKRDLEALNAAISQSDIQHLIGVAQKLGALSVITDITNMFSPINKIINDINALVRPLLNNKLTQGLKRLYDKFHKIWRLVVCKIKSELKRLGVDLGFIDTLERKIGHLEDQVVNYLVQPIKTLEDQVEKKLTGLKTNLEKPMQGLVEIRNRLEEEFDPVDAILVVYLNEAKKHGVVP